MMAAPTRRTTQTVTSNLFLLLFPLVVFACFEIASVSSFTTSTSTSLLQSPKQSRDCNDGGSRSKSTFNSFDQKRQRPQQHIHQHIHQQPLYNFFKDMIESAFENDSNLSTDKSLQQLDGPEDGDGTIADIFRAENEKTDVQKKWLQAQQNQQQQQAQQLQSSLSSSSASSASTIGAPMNPNQLLNTKWTLSIHLTGVPDFDPSNSLYGSKVNISTRRDTRFAIGADNIPETPSAQISITLLDDNVCQIEDGSFTTSKPGEWKLSEDGRFIRFSLDSKGYQRTVTTKGTIHSVAWSNRDDVQKKASATYSIAPGMVIAEATIEYGSKPGLLLMARNKKGGGVRSEPDGILSVERVTGPFGLSSKVMACGKFSAEMVLEE